LETDFSNIIVSGHRNTRLLSLSLFSLALIPDSYRSTRKLAD